MKAITNTDWKKTKRKKYMPNKINGDVASHSTATILQNKNVTAYRIVGAFMIALHMYTYRVEIQFTNIKIGNKHSIGRYFLC